MIKSTFYNLSDAKRERVIRAIMQEFAGNESEKVSINRIIKNADISRGSFYQYFDDKSDLFYLCIFSVYEKIVAVRMRNNESLIGSGLLRMKDLGYEKGYELFSQDLQTMLDEEDFILFENMLKAPDAIRNYVQMSVSAKLLAPIFKDELMADPAVRRDIDYDYYAYLLSLTEMIPVDYGARHGRNIEETIHLGFEYMRAIYDSITD